MEYRIWVRGYPKSQGAANPQAYQERIRAAAREQFQQPLASRDLCLDILFADSTARPDVDNVAKLINDALKGIAFVDDSQVRNQRVGALTSADTEACGGAAHRTFSRVLENHEFLIRVYMTRQPFFDDVETS